jgi:hypothetical protein
MVGLTGAEEGFLSAIVLVERLGSKSFGNRFLSPLVSSTQIMFKRCKYMGNISVIEIRGE